jgi:hypothetical protein
MPLPALQGFAYESEHGLLPTSIGIIPDQVGLARSLYSSDQHDTG